LTFSFPEFQFDFSQFSVSLLNSSCIYSIVFLFIQLLIYIPFEFIQPFIHILFISLIILMIILLNALGFQSSFAAYGSGRYPLAPQTPQFVFQEAANILA
jgi:hypothetical protein